MSEIVINTGDIVNEAAELVQVKAEKAKLEAREEELRNLIADKAIALRDEKMNAGEFVHMIRIINERLPVSVSFRVDNKEAKGTSIIPETFEHKLGDTVNILFGKSVVTDGCVPPAEGAAVGSVEESLLADMRTDNRNPWDFLELFVKKGMHEIMAGYPQINSDALYMPREEFLAKCQAYWNSLKPEGQDLLKEYVKTVVKPTVGASAKGNGSK